VLWSAQIAKPSFQKFMGEPPYPAEMVNRIKDDWYDLDFKYLRDHPGFRAFRVYLGCVGFVNEFMEEFSVQTVFVPQGWFDAIETKSILTECQQAQEAGAEFVELSPGSHIQLSENCYASFLEAADNTGDAVNDMSLVMHLEYGNGSALFTGDAKAIHAPDIDILKVGHHGSDTATDAMLLNETTPEIAIISAGNNNSYGHPHAVVLELLADAGADTYRTDESGAITVYMNMRGGIKVDTFR